MKPDVICGPDMRVRQDQACNRKAGPDTGPATIQFVERHGNERDSDVAKIPHNAGAYRDACREERKQIVNLIPQAHAIGRDEVCRQPNPGNLSAIAASIQIPDIVYTGRQAEKLEDSFGVTESFAHSRTAQASNRRSSGGPVDRDSVDA
jgi:hypothetical protein